MSRLQSCSLAVPKAAEEKIHLCTYLCRASVLCGMELRTTEALNKHIIHIDNNDRQSLVACYYQSSRCLPVYS
jgi:hypothetical protein